MDLGVDLLHEVDRRAVDIRVDRVQAQPVHVVVAQPHQRVVAEEAPHLVRACILQVDGVAPRRFVLIGEVRPEAADVIAGWAEVVVNHVHDDAKPLAVRRVYQALQAVWPAVGRVRRKQVHAVVAPAVLARELRKRQQLNVRHAQLAQVVELRNRPVAGAFRRKRADVQLVNDRALVSLRMKVPIGPAERAVIHNLRRTVHAFRLKCRPRVGQLLLFAVQQERVARALACLFDHRRPPSILTLRQRVLRAVHFHINRLSFWRPNCKRVHAFPFAFC